VIRCFIIDFGLCALIFGLSIRLRKNTYSGTKDQNAAADIAINQRELPPQK
jgi:hypothetical protein